MRYGTHLFALTFGGVYNAFPCSSTAFPCLFSSSFVVVLQAEVIELQQPMVCPAGSVAFIHIDSFHRTGSNITDKLKRYMLKLHYGARKRSTAVPCVSTF